MIVNRNGLRTLRYLFLIAILVLEGCVSADLCLVSPMEGALVELPYGAYRQHVVAINESKREFLTLMTRGDGACLRVIGFDGKKRLQYVCPAVLHNYSISDGLAVTEDARLFAYKKQGTRDLYVYDRETGSDTLVYRMVSSEYQWDSIKELVWLSDRRLLLFLNPDTGVGRARAVVEELDIETKAHKILLQPVYIPAICATSVSGDKSKFAICDGVGNDVVVRVMDVKTGTQLASSDKGFAYSVCWSPEGDFVYFVADQRLIKVLDVKTKREKTLMTLPFGHVCLHLAIGAGFFACDYQKEMVQKKTKRSNKMVIYSITKQEEVETIEAPFNGDWVVADNGRKIICQIGY